MRQLLILALLFISVNWSPLPAFAQEGDRELFLVASKAYEDGFYDVAIRYIEQLLKDYPNTDKKIQAKLLLGQCYFFKSQYLKAYDIFNELLVYTEFKDATLFWLGETYLKGADYKQAERQYRELVSFYPTSLYTPQAYYSLGWIYFELNNYAQAKEIFQKLINDFPDHPLGEDTAFKIGECDFNSKNYEAAISYFKNFLERFPNTTRQAEVHFYIAESYYYQNNPLEAVTYYAKAADVAYDNKLILMAKVSLGWSYLKLEKYQLSEQHFQEAYDFAKSKGILTDDVLLGQANLYTETKEYEKALQAHDQLIQQFPNSQRIADAYLGKANLHYLTGQYPQAIQTYQSLIEKLKNDPLKKELLEKAYFGLAWSHLKSGDIDTSIKTFETIRTEASNNVVKISALTQIGDAYQDIGEFQKAIQVYDRVLEEYPNSPYTDYVQYRQGIALLKMDKIDAATLSFQSLQANFPNSKYLTDIKYYLAVAYFKKNDWAMASTYINEFILNLPKDNEFLAEAHYILALSFYNLEEYKKAEQVFEKIIKNFPQQRNMIQSADIFIAKCQYKTGDVKEALKKFKLLIHTYPQTEVAQDALLWLGDHYLEAGEYDAAISHYHEFIKEFPGSDKLELVYYELGQAYQARGEYDKAINILKQIQPFKDRVLYAKASLAIADIFSKELDPQSAIETYQNIIEGSPEFKRDAYVKIADVHKSTKQFSQAIEAYREALKAEKKHSKLKDVELQFQIGDTYELANQSETAIQEYLKIPYLYVNETVWIIKAYLRIARIFEDHEKWEEAVLTYKKVLQYETEERIFAQERLDWIKENTSADITKN